MTPAEKEVWKYLRNRNFYGLKFRRQHPLRFFIADFYCAACRLVIEIDGDVHHTETQQTRDAARTAQFEAYGYRVIRFSNEAVLNELEQVLAMIVEASEGA
jgi:very-short-patch-repair endonuclease